MENHNNKVTTDWMSRLGDSVPLDQLMMPGSHDAGMSELHHCSVGAGPSNTQTQAVPVGGQLGFGSRYFDIRVDYDHGKLVTYHRTLAFGCNGQDLKDVLDQTRDFLAAHRGETAILKFSHIRDYLGHDRKVIKAKIDELLNSYAASLFTHEDAGVNLARVRLGDARGRMILVFDYAKHVNPATGRFRYKDGGEVMPGANLTVFDKYSNTDSYSKMAKDQKAKWRKHAAWGGGRFFLLSWTLTAKGTRSIRKLAAEANGHLPEVLHGQIVDEGWQKPNVVYVDFIDSAVGQAIVQHNFD